MYNVIGHGSAGLVIRGTWRGVNVVVKKLKASQHLVENSSDFRKEISVMRTIRHPNIVLFFGAGEFDDGVPFLVRSICCNSNYTIFALANAQVTELMERGSLSEVLKTPLHWEQKLRFCLDAARGMQHIHSLGYIHRDLKSGNLLVDADMRVKVADFGLARVTGKARDNDQSAMTAPATSLSLTQCVGTPLWMAPEVRDLG